MEGFYGCVFQQSTCFSHFIRSNIEMWRAIKEMKSAVKWLEVEERLSIALCHPLSLSVSLCISLSISASLCLCLSLSVTLCISLCLCLSLSVTLYLSVSFGPTSSMIRSKEVKLMTGLLNRDWIVISPNDNLMPRLLTTVQTGPSHRHVMNIWIASPGEGWGLPSCWDPTSPMSHVTHDTPPAPVQSPLDNICFTLVMGYWRVGHTCTHYTVQY